MNCKTTDLLWHISVLQRSQSEEWFINETFTNVTHAKSSMASVYRKEWQTEALLLAEKNKRKKNWHCNHYPVGRQIIKWHRYSVYQQDPEQWSKCNRNDNEILTFRQMENTLFNIGFPSIIKQKKACFHKTSIRFNLLFTRHKLG